MLRSREAMRLCNWQQGNERHALTDINTLNKIQTNTSISHSSTTEIDFVFRSTNTVCLHLLYNVCVANLRPQSR